jgi:hypothetical protein
MGASRLQNNIELERSEEHTISVRGENLALVRETLTTHPAVLASYTHPDFGYADSSDD